MTRYQKYLSKFLIFLYSMFIILFLLLESNVGFKYIVNFTSKFVTGLKIESVSGNWHNFILKKIYFNGIKFSIIADRVHVIIDSKSLLHIETIVQQIKTKNLKIRLTSDHKTSSKKIKSLNFFKKNLFFKYPLIFKNMYFNRVQLKINNKNLFFFNVSSSCKLIKNQFILYPTYINLIHINSLKSHIQDVVKNKLNIKKDTSNLKKLKNFFDIVHQKKHIFFPFNLYLSPIKCRKIKFIHYSNKNISKLILHVNLSNNMFQIKNIQFLSLKFRFQLHGNIMFHDNLMFFRIKNKMSRLPLNKKQNNILSQKVKKQLFRSQSHFKFTANINGYISLKNMYDPFYIQLYSHDLFFHVDNNISIKLKKINFILKGKLNNYFLSFKNILEINSIKSIFFQCKGIGNEKNFFLQRVNASSKKITISREKPKIHKNIFYFNSFFDENIIKKTLKIYGFLRYSNTNEQFLNIPRAKLNFGRNIGYLQGSLSNKINIFSKIHANYLNYFLPNSSGQLQTRLHVNGVYTSPVFIGNLLLRNFHWKDIYLKNFQITSKIDTSNQFSGNIYIRSRKFKSAPFNIDYLRMASVWNKKQQCFSLFLKNKTWSIYLNLHGDFDNKKTSWHGKANDIHIKTIWGNWMSKNYPSFILHEAHQTAYIFQKYEKKTINTWSHLKTSLFNKINQFPFYHQGSIHFHININFLFTKKISDIKMVFTGRQITLKKIIQEKKVFERIHYLKCIAYLKNNNIKTYWYIKFFNDHLKQYNYSGYLNIIDIYRKKEIQSSFRIVNFPVHFIDFFTVLFKKIKGVLNGNIKILGTLYQPKISTEMFLKNISINSDNFFKYIYFCLNPIFKTMKNIRINQEIQIKQGKIFFILEYDLNKNTNNIKWHLLFNSQHMMFSFFPSVRFQLFSKLNLNYAFLKYNLLGYIRTSFFFLKIKEKNFIF